jgi:tetratricopeptide (TPR) repeat protein
VLIPQVRRALEAWFGPDKVGCYDDPDLMQTAVARGAAWNTIYRTITGRPLIQPVLHDGIALETNDGNRYSLIEPGDSLPHPAGEDEWLRVDLEAPRTGRLLVDQLRIKLLSSEDGRHLLNEVWDLPRPIAAGEEIVMEYRLTAGKQLECRAFLKNDPDKVFVRSVENPMVNVVNPGTVRLKIAETEEMLRIKNGGTRENVDDYVNLAKWHAELNQREKALYYLHQALKKNGGPHVGALNLRGNYYSDLKDYDRAVKAYQEAWQADKRWTGPLFNLALLYRNTGRFDMALSTIDETLETTDEPGAYLSLKADILNRMDKKTEAKRTANQAVEKFSSLKKQDEWEMGWYITNARFLYDDKAVAEAEAEKQRRKKAAAAEQEDDDTPRPVVRGNVALFRKSTAA